MNCLFIVPRGYFFLIILTLLNRLLRSQWGSGSAAITPETDYARVPKEAVGIYPRRSVTLKLIKVCLEKAGYRVEIAEDWWKAL